MGRRRCEWDRHARNLQEFFLCVLSAIRRNQQHQIGAYDLKRIPIMLTELLVVLAGSQLETRDSPIHRVVRFKDFDKLCDNKQTFHLFRHIRES